MGLRWTAAGMLMAQQGFRYVNGCIHLPQLAAALGGICEERTGRKSGPVAADLNRGAQTASPGKLLQITAGFGQTRPESIEEDGLVPAKAATALKLGEPTEIMGSNSTAQRRGCTYRRCCISRGMR